MFTGSMVALVTPFAKGRLDLAALDRFIDFQISEGTEGLVPCGTTGEASTLSFDEYRAVVARVVKRAKGRVPVVAGAGSNNTEHAIALGRAAAKAGADGILVVTPYYNKPTQAGLFAHFSAVASKVDLPLVLYNVPSRTGVSIAPETVARLFGIKNVVAIKEASGSIETATEMIQACRIPVISGTDSLNLPLLSIGAVGAISVVSNVAPRAMRRMFDAARAGEWEAARAVHYRLYPLARSLFVEGSPVPVKAALAMMGMIRNELRLPLVPMSKRLESEIRAALKKAGAL